MNHHLQQSAQLTCLDGEPRACYQRWRETLHAEEALLLVNFIFNAYWLENAPPLELTAIYSVFGDELEVAVTDQSNRPEENHTRAHRPLARNTLQRR